MSVDVRLPAAPRARSVVVWPVCGAVLLVLSIATLMVGRLALGPGDIVDLIRGELGRSTEYAFTHIRAPRLLTAIGAGAALGLSGALFRSATRNPLGSPDVIGLSAGAGAGVAVFTLVAPGAVSAPVGSAVGVAAALLLVLLATGNGLSSTSRIIIAGIGVAAIAGAVTNFVITTLMRDESSQLAAALVGSLNSRSMEHVLIVGAALVVAVPFLVIVSHRLNALELGDGLSAALGMRAGRTRAWAIVLSVALLAGAVAVAGPVAFVALTAANAAPRLSGRAGPNLTGAALTGAIVLVSADLLSQHLPGLAGLPVGVVTGLVGGVYLGFLLVAEWRKAGA
ncbi:FecCD family ABC transporter permease [Microbacterium sp.]|uniref:FecCD family ABC transporter permease n=1 Tax=Microbacterium sp. TaxID=51671 RepID=UPI003F9A201B